MKAVALQQADKLYTFAQSALFNRATQAADKKGKYLVKDVKDLVDIDKIEKEILGSEKGSDTFKQLRLVAERLRKHRAEQEETNNHE